jgi:hypothetical protein
MKDCINLMDRFGETFRIFFDEAYDPKHRPRATLDRWMITLRGAGKGVELYPTGGDLLRVDLDRRWFMAAELASHDGVELICDGDHEKTIEFSVELFNAVDEILRFRRRPVFSPEQRERMAEVGRQLGRKRQSHLQRRSQNEKATTIVLRI